MNLCSYGCGIDDEMGQGFRQISRVFLRWLGLVCLPAS